MKVDPDDRVAVVRLGFNVLDVVDVRSDAAFEVGDDALFHLLRRETRVDPEHADNRDVDIREDIDRHCGDRRTPQDGHQNSHHDKGVRAAECQPDNPHGLEKVYRTPYARRPDRGYFEKRGSEVGGEGRPSTVWSSINSTRVPSGS